MQKPTAPSISLTKGGGAIRGIGEKFASNPVTGTGSMTVPISVSPGRAGFGPQLSLSYDSGAGNGPYGFGWSLSLPSITRKTDKGLPKYFDEEDTFILSGAEDLVPVFEKASDGNWVIENSKQVIYDKKHSVGNIIYNVRRYLPRIEGLFARIERWTNTQTDETHWRSISRDNIVTVYGRTPECRIEDPSAPESSPRVFSWLICESYDDKGNIIYYKYEKENSKNVDLSFTNERNRTDESRSSNRYLKRIKYGNKTPLNLDSDLPREFREDLSEHPESNWLFEVVFDYGEGHYEELPADPNIHQFVKANKEGSHDWERRQDSFSSYRSGFEVRTYRLCRRVLMFHHFPDELGVEDYLVRSTEFKYNESPIASFIASVTQSGFNRQNDDTYIKKSLPPLEFEYSKATIHDEVQDIEVEYLENLPQGVDGTEYQWADIDGEGLSSILTEQGNSWFYKRNVSALPLRDKDGKLITDEDGKLQFIARFAPTEQLATIPSFTNLSSGRQQLMDLAGDGQLDVVALDSPTPGFYERTKDETWNIFKTFDTLPNISWQDPNMKFVDLTGDGHADILITENNAITWYNSLAEDGFASGEKVRQALDEEKGPKLVFADGTQSIYLADISGDGLTDLVRIRNGEVCYWPNLGYGLFGAMVTMDNSPHFDAPDHFDQRHIRLVDIDGSGVTDIIYLKDDGVYTYLNESGNRWTYAEKLKSFPKVDNLSSVMAVDLLGNGTACLVWSTPLPTANGKPFRYIKLMSEKPHLLVKVINNLGAETKIHYLPSTKFYLEDKEDGKPWITKLPFPVHVVERVETYDWISRNRFVTRYAYHHGYFDGVEREFRGFGRVDQLDTEEFVALSASDGFPSATNIDDASHVPPVLTRTWFHTGAYLGRDHISNFFAGLLNGNDIGEYYQEPGLNDEEAQSLLLEDTILPDNLTIEEEQEACRSLKGFMLRHEVYAIDGTGNKDYPYGHPYKVTEQNFTIRLIQPRGDNRHSVFFTHSREVLNYHYERNSTDPRVQHAQTLEVDEFGNVLKSVAIGYGRRIDDPDLKVSEDQEKQRLIHITCTENTFTNPIVYEDNAYRTPLPAETCTYEFRRPKQEKSSNGFPNLYRFGDMLEFVNQSGDGNHEIAYEDIQFTKAKEAETNDVNGSKKYFRRLIEHVRTIYRKDDLTALLDLRKMESMALPGESYKLAFTPGLLEQGFRRNGQPLLSDPSSVLGGKGSDQGGYIDLNGDGKWWIPSGRVFYSPNSNDNANEELAYAHDHFFLPLRYNDTFGRTTTIQFDDYDLLMVETRDPLNNVVTVKTLDDQGNMAIRNDYRVLQPYWVTDPNANRTKLAFDALGLVAGTAVMGKQEDNPKQGDFLDDSFKAELSDTDIHEFYDAIDPHVPAENLLMTATTRIIYDIDRFYKTRLAFPQDPEKWEPAFASTLARETHVSSLKPDEKLKIQISFSYSDGFGREIQKKIQAEPEPIVNPRWVGSGWTIFNNKNKPVRQYEPFFSQLTEKRHRFEYGVKVGVSPVIFYNPVERTVATVHPNHTYEKVVFDPWKQTTWDVNDTISIGNPKNDPDVGDFFRRLPDSEFLPTWNELRTNPAYIGLFTEIFPDPTVRLKETQSAKKTQVHTETPTFSYFDTLGRPFLTVVNNRFERNNAIIEEEYNTRVELDIEGNQRKVTDAKGCIVMLYDYDMLGNRIHQASMEAGERWMLNDVTGKPIHTWDSRNHQFRTTYDQLRRPIESYLSEGSEPEIMVGRTVYGESQPNPESKNLRGKVVKLFDQAGIVTIDEYDYKNNLLISQRQLAQDYKTTLNWSANVPLEAAIYTSRTRFDAVNRSIQLIAPHSNQPGAKFNIIQPVFNEANLLEKIDTWLNRNTEPVELLNPDSSDMHTVTSIDYNAKGQRTNIEYGNGAVTAYEYDPLTFRLAHLRTLRGTERLQDLFYTYDPCGNITSIRDDAQQTIFFNNSVVEPHSDYTYDAIYRLIEANGREHIGQAGQSIPSSWNDEFRINLPHPNDGMAMRPCTEHYEYDSVGNFENLRHFANGGSWTRHFEYEEESLIEPGKKNNRLTKTTVGNGLNYSENYTYDSHGNMTLMPHLLEMTWDFEDQLHKVNMGGGGSAYYIYDAARERARKVIESQNDKRSKERIYLGGFEIYREYESDGSTMKLERETLHLMDDKQRIAIIETRTQGSELNVPQQLIRYQFSNHLSSASLELDEQAQIISYEEYYPYGCTSYQAVRKDIEVTRKRYRYTGKERDEESGLYYYGVRYFTPWLGRWTAADPSGLVDGLNLYCYVRSNPVVLIDPQGTLSWLAEALDDFVNPSDPVYRGVADSFSRTGEGLVKAVTEHPIDTALSMTPGTPQFVIGAIEGTASAIKKTGEAGGQLVYSLANPTDEGQDYKAGEAVGDLLQHAPQVILTIVGLAGAAGPAKPGIGPMADKPPPPKPPAGPASKAGGSTASGGGPKPPTQTPVAPPNPPTSPKPGGKADPNVKPDVYPEQLKRIDVKVRESRSVPPSVKKNLHNFRRKLENAGIIPKGLKFDITHEPPFSQLPPGTPTKVGIQRHSPNRAGGRLISTQNEARRQWNILHPDRPLYTRPKK